jgi:predicted ATPase
VARPGFPASLSSFVGRSHELKMLASSVHRHRLVTVVGPGGAGKTRLVLEGLESAEAELAGFVDLGSLPDVALLAGAVLRGCGMGEEPGVDASDRLAACLADVDAILVLDTCEHMREQVAALVDTTLRRCPRLRVIATSRVALGVLGEAVLDLSGLGSDGVALFMDRARSVQPEVASDEECVRTICGLADGLPLGIELAAARARSMSLTDIRLGMAERLRFLSRSGPADAARHLSLEASIGWSYGLLNEQTRHALRALSLLPGAFTREAATTVLDDGSLAALDVLVDYSLVQFDADDGRYSMLDTVREYGARELEVAGEVDAAGHRLVCWAGDFAHAAESGLTGGDLATVHRVEGDQDGVHAALAYATDSGQLLDEAADLLLVTSWPMRAGGVVGEPDCHCARGAIAGSDVVVFLPFRVRRGRRSGPGLGTEGSAGDDGRRSEVPRPGVDRSGDDRIVRETQRRCAFPRRGGRDRWSVRRPLGRGGGAADACVRASVAVRAGDGTDVSRCRLGIARRAWA